MQPNFRFFNSFSQHYGMEVLTYKAILARLEPLLAPVSDRESNLSADDQLSIFLTFLRTNSPHHMVAKNFSHVVHRSTVTSVINKVASVIASLRDEVNSSTILVFLLPLRFIHHSEFYCHFILKEFTLSELLTHDGLQNDLLIPPSILPRSVASVGFKPTS